MKKIKFLLLLALIAGTASAQVRLSTSPFHHLPIPRQSVLLKATLSSSKTITAYRFVLPFAGYSPITRQLSTGVGYGWSKLHFIDSTQKYYTDLSIFGAIFINGNVTPTPYNYTSIGAGVGFLNNLIIIAPSYNLPNSAHTGGAFDLKLSLGVPLN